MGVEPGKVWVLRGFVGWPVPACCLCPDFLVSHGRVTSRCRWGAAGAARAGHRKPQGLAREQESVPETGLGASLVDVLKMGRWAVPCCPARAGETEARLGKRSRNPRQGDLFGERGEREEGDGVGGPLGITSSTSSAPAARPRHRTCSAPAASQPAASLPASPTLWLRVHEGPPRAATAPQRAPRLHGPALLTTGKDAAPRRASKPHPSSLPPPGSDPHYLRSLASHRKHICEGRNYRPRESLMGCLSRLLGF